MVTTQDASIGFAAESTYRTGVTPTRWVEFTEESLDWNKQTKQGVGLRVGGRVPRSTRRVVAAADGGGDFGVEVCSKGLGTLWQACLGAGVSTLISGTAYQQNFTLGDTPSSLTIQKGIPQAGGTVDAYTFLGCMVSAWELSFANADIAKLKVSVDAGDLTTATAYAAPSYPTSPVNLFHFAQGSISTGTLTAPTTTALASALTPQVNIKGGSLTVNNNLKNDRFVLNGSGRKNKPTVGLRSISGKFDIEYDSSTYRDLVLNDTPLCAVLTFTSTEVLSTGFAQFQVVLPELKFDNELAKASGPDLVTQSMSFTVLDNQTAAQPLWVIHRTADTAL